MDLLNDEDENERWVSSVCPPGFLHCTWQSQCHHLCISFDTFGNMPVAEKLLFALHEPQAFTTELLLLQQDAVGELLGNMAGPGGRLRPPEAGRRARIMQSRGTRVLGDGPTSAVAAGPNAPSAQHRSGQALLQQLH